MNSHPESDVNLDAQAAFWAARLDGATLSTADRTALDRWLAESPLHRARLSSYCQFSADLEAQLPALARAGKIAVPAEEKRVLGRASFLRVAGFAVVTAAVLAVCFGGAKAGSGFKTFSSSAGQRQTVSFPDGTRVELDAHTSLQFSNRGRTRRVKLLQGEAFFEVSKDPARPFTVETPGGLVRVTGTTFDVRSDDAAFEVTVIEGAVEVRPGAASGQRPAEPVALVGGDRLWKDSAGVKVEKFLPAALEDLLAWRQGIVVFDDTPLDVALSRFSRYHGRAIVVTPAAATRRVGGRHSLADLDGFIAGIEEPLGIRAVREADGNLRVGLRSE